MNGIELLTTLSQRGAHFWAEEGQIRFRAPEGVLTPAVRNRLRQCRSEILELLRRDPETYAPVYPLSQGQRALWFLHRTVPESPAYHVAFTARLRGAPDLAALERVFQALSDRHPTLRTTYFEHQGEPLQKIHASAELRLERIDAASWSDEELREQVTAAYEAPFDLTAALPVRVEIFSRAPDDHVLLFTFHHISGDGWSVWMLVDELRALYAAEREGRAAALAPPPVLYAETMLQKERRLAGPEGEALRAYWEKQLAGPLPVLDLPADFPRLQRQRYRGASQEFVLEAELVGRLNALAKEHGTTLYTVLLAAYQVLLHRYSGQDEILVGSPTFGRDAATMNVVGDFINTVVVRADLSGNPAFTQLLGRLRPTVLEALEHQDHPFSRLVETLQASGDLSRSPIFQALFVLQRAQRGGDLTRFFVAGRSARLELGDLVAEPYFIPIQEGQFDLTLELFETGEVLAGALKYNTDVFLPATIRRMAEHFLHLVRGIVEAPATRIGALPLVGAAERRHSLSAWNRTRSDYPARVPLHRLFAQRVAERPEAVAVEYGERVLSYGELDRRAARLAMRLQSLGVRPEVTVGICLERSPELVVAILATLKAGGVYLPLDPDQRSKRLDLMLADARPRVLITSDALAAELSVPGAAVVRIAEALPALGAGGEPSAATDGESLALVMYTSGSTGTPKGIAIPHRAISRLVLGADYIRLREDDRIAQTSNAAFDASTFEIWGALLSGGRLVGFHRGEILSAHRFADAVRARRITILFLTTALFNQLARETVAPFRGLNQVLFGGEAVDPHAVRTVLEGEPPERLLHLYGPAESTTYTSWHAIREVPENARTIPIGKPIANTRIYVLDRWGEPAPDGVPGELFAGDAGLARGYLGRPAATAERFVPDPFSGEGGARLYRTGDCVRRLPAGHRDAGAIEFLGRLDHQVKIRGFRIELGEIEAVLRCRDEVGSCLVTLREVAGERGLADKRLVAYLVPPKGRVLDLDALRGALCEELPGYMIPWTLVALESFPLTPNGKIDRAALPAPEPPPSGLAAGDIRPRTPVEELLAGIWARILGIPELGVHASFFELGGHSLLATQMMSRVREAFAVDLPIHVLFERPTVAALAEAVEAALRGGESEGEAVRSLSSAPPIVRRRRATAPLAFAQERLWFLEQLAPGGALYNVPLALRIAGTLRPEILARCLTDLVARHQALRTGFATRDGEPLQVISEPFAVELPCVDLATLAPAGREGVARALLSAAGRRPFDLGARSLIEVLLVRLDAAGHLLLINLHHLVTDGWSTGLLLRELAELYGALSAGRRSPLGPRPVQYADFACWQRQQLRGEILDTQLAYWRRQLGDDLAPLRLPADRPYPPVQSFRGTTEDVVFSAELTAAVRRFSERRGLTPFMTLAAAFAALLARYGGRRRILLGTPVANRQRSELEDVVGFLGNTLVLGIETSGNPLLATYLERVRRTALGAYAHQDLPFEKLVGVLQPERDPAQAPLVQVVFAFQNAPPARFKLPRLTFETVLLERGTAKFDLNLTLDDAGEAWNGYVEYRSDLFDPPTIRRLIGHLRTLVEGLVAAPERRLGELGMLSAEERRQLLGEPAAVGYPRRPRGLDEIFAEQVRRRPEAVALSCEDRWLSYAELDRRAERLGQRLRSSGVGPHVPVGLCLERTPELPVAIVGILKAGGAYVPIDPAHPAERIAWILEDSRTLLLVTVEALRDRLPAHRARVLCLDAAEPHRPVESSLPAADPDRLAYVIYTSGSTGRPKGVGIAHRNAVSLFEALEGSFGFGAGEVWTLFHSYAFDFSVWELWGALLYGGRLVVVPFLTSRSPDAFGRLLARERVSVVSQTPSAFAQLDRALAAEPQVDRALSLRRIVFGGEVLDFQILSSWFERHGDRMPQLVNMYGITETTVHVTERTVTLADLAPETGSRIGRAIASLRIWVLDERLEPVPEIVPGELYVAGAGLARGYLGRPALTAERFLPDPRSAEPGGRLYRTGDLGRWRGDDLEYLGRIDHQVKIRGFRIELGEIRAALSHHPAVGESVVAVRDDLAGGRGLAAYVVAREHRSVSLGELRDFLRSRLPEYMVPAAWTLLDQLPLTATGKVDLRALPEPRVLRRAPRLGTASPRRPEEELLATLWAEVLGVAQVDDEDDFFDLGGHSLLATELVTRIRELFRVELPLRAVFEAPTLAGLSERIRRSRGAARPAELGAITPIGHGGAPPLALTQKRLWFLQRLIPESCVYNVPLVIRMSGALDLGALRRSLGEILRRHQVLRSFYPTVAGQPGVRVLRPDLSPSPAAVDLRRLDGTGGRAQAHDLLLREARRPFELEVGPLVRFVLLRPQDDEHQLFVNLHHLIADGHSLEIFLEELAVLYTADVEAAAAPLDELPVQYSDFAAWQQRELRGELIEAQLGHWKRRLTPLPPTLKLPIERRRPAIRSARGAECTLALSPELSDGLRRLSREAGTTLFMTLLAAFEILLARYAGREFTVGTAVANRNRIEVGRLIGLFVNTLVLRADLGGNPSLLELLGRVREQVLEAHAHQDVPFEQIVEALGIERDLSRHPLFQVLFTLQHHPLRRRQCPGLTLEMEEIANGTAKLDLALGMVDSDAGLSGRLIYNRDLFDASDAARLLHHYKVLLAAVVADPTRAIDELPVLDAPERRLVLCEWNVTELEVAAARFDELVAEQAARRPDAVALTQGDEHLTYAGLDRRANQLAHYLRALGVGPESLVALCVARSPALVVGFLGILKAGGAYLPLDPAYPGDRLAFMLADAGAAVLLTREERLDLEGHGARLVRLDRDGEVIARQPTAAPEVAISDDHPAYVIYTSGSTGRPKGSQLTHRGLRNLSAAQARSFAPPPESRILQFSSSSFDASVFEMVMALRAGARLCLADAGALLVGEELGRLLRRYAVTQATLPPSSAAQIPPGPYPALETLIVAGESCPVELVARWGPGRRFWNAYGPTETTVWATVAECIAGELRRPSIGRPIANTRVYVMDRRLEPVPIGVPGELGISGVGLARGYLHRPALTAATFVPDPFSDRPGARVYRSGDLVRFRGDGTLEFEGRIDHQVKIRGQRIEPEEVEAVLRRHPGLREVAVVARESAGGQGELRLVAYLVPGTESVLRPDSVRRFLRDRLPPSMVPAAFVELSALPRLPSGKLDRAALPAPESRRPELGTEFVAPQSELEQAVARIWAAVLRLDRVGRHDNFFDLGGHSLLAVELHHRLQRELAPQLRIIDLFHYPTVHALAGMLSGLEPTVAVARGTGPGREAIAVIGMAGRFPDAADLDAFWCNLADAVCSIRFFSREELAAAGADPAFVEHPSYVPAGGVLDGVELFDAAFFGYSPGEAELLDPQHRLLLETAWQALDRAGYNGEHRAERIGVFAGMSASTYLLAHLHRGGHLREREEGAQMLLGTSPDFLTTRISYKLNLRGPSYTVQTACSTSLVAVHLACESLLSGACDMALAGGVSVTLPQEMGYLYVEGGTESPDGFCRAFDEEARGTVSGNGVGVVVLKRLSAAERDGDPIHAVVRGSAINNDGALKVGYTAPGIDGQAAVVAAALDDAGVGPETIGYVEAHGTATPLGDPIEIAALTQAYQGAGLPPGSCAIGAVKTNVGHLDASAGIAGLIKTVLALEHKTLPASLHFRTPNPEIDFAHSPFYVNAETRPWAARGGPRRAGVSAFGIGGTNAHVVLEEAPEPEPSPPGRPCQLLVLSARTPTALERATEELMRHLEAHPGLALADVAHTLRVGRRSFPHRRVVIGADAAEAIAAWQQGDRKRILTGAAALSPFDGASSDNGPQTASSQRLRPTAASETPPAVVFLFPGQGSQYPRMTEELYRWEPVFREQLDRCAELAEPHLGRDLRSVLYRGADEESGTVRELDRTCITQPALFAVEYALAMLWHSWGVRPAALIGHSIGEYVAACLAGVFSLEEALALVCERGRLVQQQPGGSMLAVELAEDELRGLLREPLALAAVNGPVQCVVSGPAEAVAELAAALAERGITHRRLKTSHAFHSGMLEPMLGEFAARVTGISLEPPRLRFVSNLTGTWITAGEATNPAYWVRQLRETVRFDAGLREILKDPGHLLLEVGPGRTLTQLARAYADRAPAVASLAGARRRGSELAAMLTALGRLWLAGVEPDWAALPSGEKRRRVPLPSYPFERRRFWIDAPQEGPAPRARALDDWFYVPSWKRLELPPAAGEPSPSDNGTVWLVFAGAASLAGRLVRQLGDAGASVLLVRPGARFARLEGAVYELPARQPEAFAELVADLLSRCPQRVRILHLWHLDPLTARDQILDRGFYSLILLAQALAAAGDGAPPVEVLTISSGLYQVTGNEPIEPLKATLEGAQRVLPQEFPGLRCRSLEVVLPEPGSAHEERLVGRLLAEAAVGEGESVVAYRGRHRWVQIEEPIRLPAPSSRTRLKRGGVYLLTGGLGGIALGLAGHLARELEARLVLVARTAFPERARWETLLADPQTDPRLRARLAALREIESCGGRILIVRADVTRRDEMERAIAAATQAFGPIDGVLHAAGVAGGTLVRRQSPEIAERVLAPKIDGTLVLDELFRDRAPGFLVLFSSLAAVVGGLGQADYCAANAFLDAFAQQRAAEGRPVVAIDWDRWPGIGMAAEPPAVFGEQTPSGLDAGQGFEALHRILATDCAQLLVSVGELSALRRRVATLSIRTLLEPPATPGASRHPRPELSSAYAAPQGGIEEQLAEIWKALLGIDRIGRDDDFFELGGHSLMATRLISRLPREFRVSLSLQALFDSPTLAEFARAIESAGEQPPLRPRGERIRRRARELVRLSVDGGEIAIPKPG